MNKFIKKLFPWRNAPAMEITTTFRSLIFSLSRIGLNSSAFNWKECSTGATIWMALADSMSAEAILKRQMPIASKIKATFITKKTDWKFLFLCYLWPNSNAWNDYLVLKSSKNSLFYLEVVLQKYFLRDKITSCSIFRGFSPIFWLICVSVKYEKVLFGCTSFYFCAFT